jgi:DNA polymerase I
MKVLIVDAMNVFTRAFCANPAMSDKGQHVGGSVGFLKSLGLMMDILSPNEVCVIWEGGGSVRRRSIYKDYKEGRRPPKLNRFYEDDLPATGANRDMQISQTVNFLRCLPIYQVYVDNCEADDVIGYLAKTKYKNDEVYIASSDKDFYQLVNENIKVWSVNRKIVIDTAYICNEFNVHPINFCTARSFIGDKSDNLPGIKGTGFKLLSRKFPEIKNEGFISVEMILKSAKDKSTKDKSKLIKGIVENNDVINRNWKLMQLDTSNVSARQVKKINDIFEIFSPRRNKIGLLRALIKEGIKAVDVDRLFMSTNFINKY